MPKKKVISLLEFLRTGKIHNLSVGSTIDDVIQVFGNSGHLWDSPYVMNSSLNQYGDLEFWYHKQTKELWQIKFYFGIQKKFTVPRWEIDPWEIHQDLQIETAKCFFKSVNLEYKQSQQSALIEVIKLSSEVTLLFDSEYTEIPTLAYLGISKKVVWEQLEMESTQ